MTQIEIINGKRKKQGEPLPETINEWRWVEEVVQERPSYNPETHRLQRTETITETELVIGWDVVELTAEQKTNIQESKQKQAVLDAGFDTGLGYALAINTEDRNAFTQLMVLLRESGVPDTYEVTITDKDGVNHSITYGDLKPLLVQYGQYCLSLRGQNG